MKLLQTNKSKFLAIMIILILGFFSMKILAQEKDETKSKLDNLKGKIEKLTIKADGKDVVFEGKDAEKLVGMLRSSSRKGFMFKSDDGKMMKMRGGNVMMFRSEDNDADEKDGENKKNIKVEVNDSGKKITVTTMKDGKEETKTYEGDEAEKFLKDENGMKHFNIQIDGDEDMPKEKLMFFKHMGGNNCGCSCCGGEKMMRKHSMGKNMKHMIIEEKEDDEKSEKKVDKK
ncbi:MAG: hypothetical protein NTZ27_08945 [Ignavibacteriales bacterium]|nr:hypothetical protein [Ignavibacteriales bacterium]